LKKALLIILIQCSLLYSQVDTIRSQKEWEDVRDKYAVIAILMLARMDTLNIEIDSLKKVKEYAENFDCEEELYKLVGATKEQVSDFRIKFNNTESRISSKSGAPDEARSSYYEEIRFSKIRCLPEFSDRFIAMNNNLEAWENTFQVVKVTLSDSFYTVVEGDYLRKIAFEKYGDEKLWKLIWEANRKGVYNADALYENYKKKISNPRIIHPGQILRIPPIP